MTTLKELMELDSERRRVTKRERQTRTLTVVITCLVALAALGLWGWLVYLTRAARVFSSAPAGSVPTRVSPSQQPPVQQQKP